MANRTVKDAKSIKGTNPQYLVEKIIRSRIYDCKYWKEECFALTAELLVDKAMELRYLGGVHGGNVKPSPFLCLILKMLQIQPEKDIIVEFIKNDDYKYVRALGAYYMRLTGTSLDCFNYLEPLYNDYRKLRRQNREGAYELVFMDEFIDELLREERVCDVILPRLQKRQVLEENNEIQPRLSVLEESENEDLDEDLNEEESARDHSKTGKSDNKKRKTDDSDRKSTRRSEREYEGHRRRKSSSSSHSSSDSSPDPDRNRRRERERRSSRDNRRDNVSDRRRERGRDSSKDRERNRRRDRNDRDHVDRSRRDRDERGRNDRDRDRDRDRHRHRRR